MAVNLSTLKALETLRRLEEKERNDLALGLIERALAVAPVVPRWSRTIVKDQDLLGQAVEWLKRSPRWQREEDRLRRHYGLFPYGPHGADRRLLDRALAVCAITDWDLEETRKAERARKADKLREDARRAAKQKAEAAQTKPTKPAKLVYKTLHRSPMAPQPGESRDEFFDRCRDELADTGEDADAIEQECEIAWSQRRATGAVQHKSAKDGIWFTLSDESVDRCGDIVLQNWNLTEFERNPVALWAHSSSIPPIGRWHDLRVENKSLVGRLELAPANVSERFNEIRACVLSGLLRSCSVGFNPTKSRPRKSAEGMVIGTVFEANTLIEVSLTPTPANANALAVAKRLNISAATRALVFKESRHAR
jgi:HK97 family phage prohead protease